MKFIAPNIDEIPAKCKLNIAKSTDPPEWNSIDDKGGYTVQPVPAPPSTKLEEINNINAGGNNKMICYLILGKPYQVLQSLKVRINFRILLSLLA